MTPPQMSRISKNIKFVKEYKAVVKSHFLKAHIHFCLDEEDVWMSQSDHHNIDQPKMPRISKRASLLKDFEAIAKSRAVKAYILFCLDEMTVLEMKLMTI